MKNFNFDYCSTYIKTISIETDRCFHLINDTRHYWPMKFSNALIEKACIEIGLMGDQKGMLQFGHNVVQQELLLQPGHIIMLHELMLQKNENQNRTLTHAINFKKPPKQLNKKHDNFKTKVDEHLLKIINNILRTSKLNIFIKNC